MVLVLGTVDGAADAVAVVGGVGTEGAGAADAVALGVVTLNKG